MKVIFLDIDGVLNYRQHFVNIYEKRKNLFYLNDNESNLQRKMLEIDDDKLALLKQIIEYCDAKVVVISAWKNLKIYPLIEKKLIEKGIPIIGTTVENSFERGSGIKKYLQEHYVDEYIILDDDIFEDYDEKLLERLVKTSFYENGLNEKLRDKAIELLKTKRYPH